MPLSGRRRGVFAALVFAAMGAATLAPAALGILATFIIDDLAISRGTLGWIVSTNVLVAALLSPFAGALTDRLGGRNALVAVFATSGIAFAVFGLAGGVAAMLAGSAIAAASQAGGNPATNTLIGAFLPPGERGVVTGIKQSGVQAGIAVAGLTMPSMALALGWRTAMLIVAAGPLVAAGLTLVAIPHDRTRADVTHRTGLLPTSAWWLAGFGGVFGFAGAVSFYLALFAEESLGLDPRLAGAAVALSGIVAFAARIAWARYAERNLTYRRPLAAMAVLGILAGAMLLASTEVPGLLWPGVVLVGAGTSAWNSVGMLAVIDEAGTATGRASGVVLLGFLGGLGIGPPIFGATVDATDSYTTMWLLSIVASAAALGLVMAWRRSAGARGGLPIGG